ncbi:hypothetical protein [Actinomadura sp. 6K520]|uniref:hypothetical protein n=1 Tax=Actinomadura sp. 6K520 TaxID=2530364 RepID=UPI00104C3203|nr:hypothetical protein [Actinomadura sp. 6K520]TDE25112.1 hypothetical protein E1289_26865 [Actinomadura sp. 6K520]
MLAYFLPFFTSLVFLLSRSRNVKYHAIHSALTDVLTTCYLVGGSIVMAIYGGLRYGSEEIPEGDVPVSVFAATVFIVPLGLRAYCFLQIVRKGTARLKVIGTLAQRIVYGGPVNARPA